MGAVCRVTPTFRKIELSWVRAVVICTAEAAIMSRSVLPAKSAIASRLSAYEVPRGGSARIRVGNKGHC
jgi:hypothetical protein